MSGTYKLDSQLFPKNPLRKRWTRNRIATGGTREPIFSAIWQFEMNFGALVVNGENSYFESRFIAGGLYNAELPHPITGALVGFTGVSIDDASFEFGDIDRDYWANNSRVVLGVDLQATGTV